MKKALLLMLTCGSLSYAQRTIQDIHVYYGIPSHDYRVSVGPPGLGLGGGILIKVVDSLFYAGPRFKIVGFGAAEEVKPSGYTYERSGMQFTYLAACKVLFTRGKIYFYGELSGGGARVSISRWRVASSTSFDPDPRRQLESKGTWAWQYGGCIGFAFRIGVGDWLDLRATYLVGSPVELITKGFVAGPGVANDQDYETSRIKPNSVVIGIGWMGAW